MAKNELSIEQLLSDEKVAEKLKGLSFEQALKLLEELVGSVESGTLPLERSITSYERGVALVDHLRGILSGAEEKLKVLQKGA